MDQLDDQGNITEIENGTSIGQHGQGASGVNSSQNSMQTIQVSSVIQPNQQSVIQTAQSPIHQLQPQSLTAQLQLAQQNVHIPDTGEETTIDEDSKKRRDILSRRPSYRKIFNDISGSDSPTKIETIAEDPEGGEGITAISTNAISYQAGSQTVTLPGTIQIVTTGGEAVQGLQAMPMTAASNQPAVVQYQQQQDGQQYIYTATPGEVQQFLRTGQLTQGIVLNQPGIAPSNQQIAEEATRKREMRLMKNREAAKECRRKKKEYVKCLENRVAVLENQNKTLIEELKALKDLYCHKSE
ncbi:predicted protein [Nematostella vectensis]|uniref:Uncharacterized protein n=1 Tax=Nematostella vectensis TaxID=45351 RepID=A7S4F1_NEMVE|nr:cyclic AMP-responsive element-binding protein 1 [Nematostella vectensis]XP_032238556.1 cyclic AMP-responsive element-binding protein 1 [Nematostella vectensis]EDO41380.1 predicted protein [Nematostella vectensis]|eukprot:XP_001633443.1 predicted protein [Nematostella vectensis]